MKTGRIIVLMALALVAMSATSFASEDQAETEFGSPCIDAQKLEQDARMQLALAIESAAPAEAQTELLQLVEKLTLEADRICAN